MKRVALATSKIHPYLDIDGALLLPALSAVGIDAQPVVWDDAQIDWQSYDACVIRSTWDYHHRLTGFLDWVTAVSAKTALWNSDTVVQWNARKTYLREFAERGIPVVPSVWLSQGATPDLAEIMGALACVKAVIKPVVSANSDNTHVVGLEDDTSQRVLDSLVRSRDMMVQPFVHSIETRGELSLLYFQKEFSHAVLKTPKHGEYRTQEGFGSLIASITPTAEEVKFGERVLNSIDERLLYARVDVVYGEGGELWLSELELIEPSLFLRFEQEAARRFAKGLSAVL